MYRDYKIVLSVFCGRKDRTSILLRYLDYLTDKGLVDEVHLWDYCRKEEDREWLRSLNTSLLYTANEYAYVGPTRYENDHTEHSVRVKATNDAHFRLTNDTGVMYEIVIGAMGNTKNVVRLGPQGKELAADTQASLKMGEFNDVRISWKDGKLAVVLNGDTLAFGDINVGQIVEVHHSTGYGANGTWDILTRPSPTPYRYCKAIRRWHDYYHHYHNHRSDLYNNTILIKCDDDVVCIDVKHFREFLDFRIDNPHYSLVFPNIVNNGVTSSYQQHNWGVIPTELFEVEKDIAPICGLLWESPQRCQALHELFLADPNRFSYDGHHYIPPSQRVSINFFAVLPWMLEDFHEASEDDEKYLTTTHSQTRKRNKALFNKMYVTHFSFYSQEHGMNVPSLLEGYRALSVKLLEDA